MNKQQPTHLNVQYYVSPNKNNEESVVLWIHDYMLYECVSSDFNNNHFVSVIELVDMSDWKYCQ